MFVQYACKTGVCVCVCVCVRALSCDKTSWGSRVLAGD